MANGKLRIGAVNYLNTKPLIYELARLAPRAEIVLDAPSRLADGLAEGRFEVALIPSIEIFQDPSYVIVSDACIGCRGPVWSVKLFSRTPMSEIKSVALDEGSRTSAALVRILLEKQFGLRPRIESLPLGSSLSDAGTDAVLLIGDRAIHAPPGPFAEVWDLGEQWRRWSGLPFVFALWTARAGVDLGDIEPALGEARDLGLKHLAAIAQVEAAPLGLTTSECLAYLRDNLHFHLGQNEKRGLETFYDLASQAGLAPRGVKLGFHDCQSVG